MMRDMEQLINEISTFCAVHDVKESNFGRMAVNDPAFVMTLRKGRDLRLSTVEKVRVFMREYAQKRTV